MTVCKRVVFTGTVQGVGFRYTTMGIAQGFAVTGFVRNLPDGRVELIAEGADDEVERFLDAIRRRMAGYIEGHTISDESPRGYAAFVIEH
jgi:acylphosphatase